MSFRQKIFLPLVLSWISLLTVFSVNAVHNRSLRLNERKVQLANASEMAASIAKEYWTLSSTGAMSEAEAKRQALLRIGSLRFGDSGYLLVFDGRQVLMHPIKAGLVGSSIIQTRDTDGRPVYLEAIQAAARNGYGYTEFMWAKPGQQQAVHKLAYTLVYKPWGWNIMTGLYIDDLEKEFNSELAVATAWLILIATLLTAVVWPLARNVERTIGGDPALAVEAARRIAMGDLVSDFAVRAGDKTSVLAVMKTMRDALAEIVGQVSSGTELIATASRDIARGNMDLSSRTAQQAASLEETASSVEELTSTVNHSAGSAYEASLMAESAAASAQHGGMVMIKVVDTMSSITEASNRIADITSVIDGIAFQSNILALNAGVEAARAGAQGKGFAVVAEEVRALAQRSADAAKQIADLIGNSVARIDDGAKLVGEARHAMNEIVGSVNKVTTMIGAISNAAREQGTGIEHINQAISQMDQATQQNASLVEEVAAASEAMSEEAENLARVVSAFRIKKSTSV